MSFLEEALSSSSGPLLASLSAFWLRLSENASSLGKGAASAALCPGRAAGPAAARAEHHRRSSSGLRHGHRSGQHPELGESEHRVSTAPCAGAAVSRSAAAALVTEVASVKDPGTSPRASGAPHNTSPAHTGDKADIKSGLCHFEETMPDGVQHAQVQHLVLGFISLKKKRSEPAHGKADVSSPDFSPKWLNLRNVTTYSGRLTGTLRRCVTNTRINARRSTHMSCTTMYWWGMSPSTPLCLPSHQSSDARWYRSSEAPFLKESSRGERPT